MATSQNEKANDWSRWPDSNDRTGQGAIESKDTPQQSAKLVLMLSLIQSLQVLANEYAMETDCPAWGVVDAADLVDAAHDEIAFALLDGGKP